MRLKQPEFMWTYFGQFGHAMWRERNTELMFDYDLWKKMTDKMAAGGLNVLVIDLGEALVYPSHPELAVKGSWSPEQMKAEIARLKAMGIMAIPKLNFSTCHDVWLNEYARMVSTPVYYKVCSEVIADVAKIFDEAPLLHLGYDEEERIDQADFPYIVIRQGELWWHDFFFFVEETRKHGFRPWIWSDPVWRMGEEFLKRMPKDVLQSNWYYFTSFNEKAGEFVAPERPTQTPWYRILSERGFEQVPCSSNYKIIENCALTALHCRKVIKPELLKGFMHAPWCATIEKNKDQVLKGVSLLIDVKNALV